MSKLFSKILLGVFAVFVFAGTSFAASVSVRLEQPKSPTNQDNFDLIFVALDIQGQPITVKCFKKGPSDGSFTQFGSDIALGAGGNTGNCSVGSSIMNTNGTYQFYVTATAGADTVTSTIDSVDFNTGGPGTPSDFSKSKNNPCEYQISYKTADDSGKTVKVELYRSDNQVFNADSGTRVGIHAIGSNTTDSFTNGISDCNKTYYYVLRAFDVYGNGSGLVGDSSVTVTTTTTATTVTTASGVGGGAIPVSASTVGATEGVLGEEAGVGTEAEKEVLSATESAEPTITPEVIDLNAPNWILTHKKISLLVILILGGIAFYLFRKFKKRVE